jgi:hypothetical protein
MVMASGGFVVERDDGEQRAEGFLLGNTGFRAYAGEHGGCDEVPILDSGGRPPPVTAVAPSSRAISM